MHTPRREKEHLTNRIVAHGIAFYRRGACQQCGACGCGRCPHHYEADGLHWCDVYDHRDEVCVRCSRVAGEQRTHASCIGFPDNPWIAVVRDGTCGYWFERVDGGSMDDLPFLDGGPYRVGG